MSKAPKRPSQRDDLRQQGDAAGAQPPKSSTRKLRGAPKRDADTVLDSLTAEIPSKAMEGPEGNPIPSLPSERGDPLLRDGSLGAEGNQNESNQQSPHSRVRDEVEQTAQTAALEDDFVPTESNKGVASDLPRPSEGAEMRAHQRHGSIQHHPTVHDLQSDSLGNGKSSSRIAPQATSDRVRNASGQVTDLTQEGAARGAQTSRQTNEPPNPIYILAAITLGIPALLSIPLIGLNPGVQEGTFTTVLGFLLLSAFVTAVVFEIKRLVDHPSDADHH